MLLAVLLTAPLFSCIDSSNANPPKAVNGVLDLRSWNFPRNGPVDLEGTWEFYWNSLYSAGDFNQKTKQESYGLMEVPSTWNDTSMRNPRPVYGYATYRLRVLLPSDVSPLSLRVPAVDSAYKINVNGKDLFANGLVGRNGRSSRPVYYAPVRLEIPREPEIELIVQMSNYDFPRPGMRDAFSLDTTGKLLAEAENTLVLNIFVVGAMFIMALYHLGLFYQRRSDRSSLYFALLCISTLGRLLVTGEAYAYRFSWFTWEIGSKVEYLSLLGWTFGFMFIRSFYPKEVSLKIMKPVFALIAVLSLVVVCTPAVIFTRLLFVFDVLSLFMIAYFLYVLLAAVIRRRPYAVIFSAGIVVFAATIVNDMLLGYRLIDSAYIMPYGLFVFFFVQSYLLSNRFSNAFVAVEVLSRDLEARVAERTRELEVERNKLEHNGLVMEKHLSIAHGIQQHLLTRERPSEGIFALYNPLMQVGGDFYDYLAFDDSDTIGIFLSDVSGHGVPAALITSMIKSIILQAGEKKKNPAELLLYINETLLGQIAGNFVTAFYGIYNPVDKTMVYANAGHPQPYLITRDSVVQLQKVKTYPLALRPPDWLKEHDRLFVNIKEQLPSRSKLLLYTDGLTEARPVDSSGVYFEDGNRFECFKEFYKDDSESFVKRIYGKLVEFRGSDIFEDDVCIICLDVE